MRFSFFIFVVNVFAINVFAAQPKSNLSLYMPNSSAIAGIPCDKNMFNPPNATFSIDSPSSPTITTCSSCIPNGATMTVSCNPNTAIAWSTIPYYSTSVACLQGIVYDNPSPQGSTLAPSKAKTTNAIPQQCAAKCFISDNNLAVGTTGIANSKNAGSLPQNATSNGSGISNITRISDGSTYSVDSTNKYYAVDIGDTVKIACNTSNVQSTVSTIMPLPRATTPVQTPLTSIEANGNYFQTTCQRQSDGTGALSRQFYCGNVTYCKNSDLKLTDAEQQYVTQSVSSSGVASIQVPLTNINSFGSTVSTYNANPDTSNTWQTDPTGYSKPDTKVTVQCSPYHNSPPTITCNSDGTWSKASISCTANSYCKNSDLKLTDAEQQYVTQSVSSSGVASIQVPLTNINSFGSTVSTYNANPDTSNTWQTDPTGYSKPDTKVTVQCSPYHNSPPTITCNSDGTWSKASISCTANSYCKNSDLKLTDATDATDLWRVYVPQSVSSSGVASIQVPLTNINSFGSTVSTYNANPDTSNTWQTDPTGYSKPDTKVTVQCSPYHNSPPTITCNSDGTWSKASISCTVSRCIGPDSSLVYIRYCGGIKNQHLSGM